MMIYFLVFVLSLRWGQIEAIDAPGVLPSTFCYDDPTCGPETWTTGQCKTGKQQSPIDISTLTQRFITRHHAVDVKFETTFVSKIYAQNNGHSLQFQLTPNNSALESSLVISGGGLSDVYKFAQLHFHWGKGDFDGSEHTINRKRFPMELHVVHYRQNYSNLAEALDADDREAVAVMGILFHIGRPNPAMQPIVDIAKDMTTPASSPTEYQETHMELNMGSLFPKGDLQYVTYLGSLTTPTCLEKVIWTIFLKPVEISEEQLSHFRAIHNHEGVSNHNYRPVQPINGRKLNFYSTSAFTRLEPLAPLLKLLPTKIGSALPPISIRLPSKG